MNRRNFLKACSVPASVGVGLPQLSMANGNNIDNLQLKGEELNTINQLSRFRALGDECLENFIEIMSFTGEMAVTTPDSNPYYVPKVVVTDPSLKTAFDQQESIKGLDYIFDDITNSLDEKQIKKQFYFTDMIFLPTEMADPYKVNRMLRVLEIVKILRAQVIIIAILPFSWEGEQKHKISRQTMEQLNSLDVSYILIPPNIPKGLNRYKAKRYLNKLVVQSVRAPVELVTCMGLPSGTSCVVDPILSMNGQATMGIGTSAGSDRAVEATIKALKSPSFDLISLTKAKSILVNITAGKDYTIHEYEDVCKTIGHLLAQKLSPEICAFSVIKPEINNKMDVTILATGINNAV